jgi:hypothetical protein
LQGFLISHPFLLEAKWPTLTRWMGGAATEITSSACRFQIDLWALALVNAIIHWKDFLFTVRLSLSLP